MKETNTMTESEGNLGKRPSQRFPKIHIHEGLVYETGKVTRRNLWYYRHIGVPFEDKLGFDVFRSPDEVRHNIRPGGEVTLVKPARGKDSGKNIAIATREMRQGILVTGVVVVNEEYRRKGIARHLAEDVILRHKPKAATSRTRVWQVIRTYEGLEYQGERLSKVISPIDTGGRLTQEAKDQLVTVLTAKEREELDLETGLYPDDTYPRITRTADLRNFAPSRNNLEGTRIFNAMREMGIDPARGNGLRYWIEFDQDVLEKASAAYNPREVVILPAPSRFKKIIAAIFDLPIINFIQPSFKKS